MRLQGNGKVGIGTSAPTETLDVAGTVSANTFYGNGSMLTDITPPSLAGISTFVTQNYQSSLFLFYNAGNPQFSFERQDGSDPQRYNLFVDSSDYFNLVNKGGGLQVTAKSGFVKLTTQYANPIGTARSDLYIDSTGKVGIGTNSPTQKLDIVETMNVQGLVITNNFNLNTVSQWELFVSDDFADDTGNGAGSLDNWTASGANNSGAPLFQQIPIQDSANSGSPLLSPAYMLGGRGAWNSSTSTWTKSGFGNGATASRTITGIPSHTQIKVSFKLHLLESWDAEEIFITLNSGTVYQQTRMYHQITLSPYSNRWQGDYIENVDLVLPSVGSTLTIGLSSNLNENSENEARGISNFEVYIR